MTKKSKIITFRLATVMLWMLAIYLMIYHDKWLLFSIILGLHTAEVFLKGYRIGIKNGYSEIYSILMTLVWGFTWWLYLEDEDAG